MSARLPGGPAAAPATPATPIPSKGAFMLSSRVVLAAFLGLLLIAPLVMPPFYVTLLNYIGLYAMVALGLVLLTGVGGL
ncbi:MAG: metal-dependent hydrolase, partial [Azoarcus sp.]|nr:metal-dependent hydrolase [Azoarcus sp.]